MSLINAQALTIRHGAHTILHDVNFTIEKGEIVTVVGPNGSGKSTLIRALIGAEKLGAGTVTRQGDLRIGYVPQRLAIDRSMPMTVARFLALAGLTTGDILPALLDKIGINHLESRQIFGLSVGEFQRVLLAHALLNAPDILVLDEPTQGLDQPGVASFYRLIAEVRDRLGCAVLLVSHDLHVVMSASDRVICLNGHVCCEGSPTIVSAAPEYRALFGLGTEGALALYRHEHDHAHDHHHHAHGENS